MDKSLEEQLYSDFPELYRGRNESLQENLMPLGFTVRDGWYDIIYDLSEKIVDYCQENDFDIPKVFQVKEKFAGLRFYLESYPDEKIREFIEEAEQRSFETCEVCGSEGKKWSGSWIKTLCEKHAEKQGYRETVSDQKDETPKKPPEND